MRVIAGKYRGRNLKSPPSLEVRPTSDRLRETLFNVIAPRIVGTRFLDLCAGSGAIGIEALSRGAAHVTFVDRSRKMCDLIRANLHLFRVPEHESDIIQADASTYLREHIDRQQMGNTPAWDIVFFDPPYASDYLRVLGLFGVHTIPLIGQDGLLIVEHHHKHQLPDEIDGTIRSRFLHQGDSALSFYRSRESRQ